MPSRFRPKASLGGIFGWVIWVGGGGGQAIEVWRGRWKDAMRCCFHGSSVPVPPHTPARARSTGHGPGCLPKPPLVAPQKAQEAVGGGARQKHGQRQPARPDQGGAPFVHGQFDAAPRPHVARAWLESSYVARRTGRRGAA